MSLFQSIGKFFAKLFGSAKREFNKLSDEQKDAIIKGVNVSQIIKEGYKEGANYVVGVISSKLNVSNKDAEGILYHVLNTSGINAANVQVGVDKLAERIENGITDDEWNNLWRIGAKNAASWISTGNVNWISLGIDVLEFVYHKIFKGEK